MAFGFNLVQCSPLSDSGGVAVPASISVFHMDSQELELARTVSVIL